MASKLLGLLLIVLQQEYFPNLTRVYLLFTYLPNASQVFIIVTTFYACCINNCTFLQTSGTIRQHSIRLTRTMYSGQRRIRGQRSHRSAK